MIASRLAVCAESVVRDAETNTVSVFNIIEELGATGLPARIAKLSVMFVLESTIIQPAPLPGYVTFTLDGRELNRVPVQVDFQEQRRTRVILVISGIVVEAYGVLRVSLDVDDQPGGQWDILIYPAELSPDEVLKQ